MQISRIVPKFFVSLFVVYTSFVPLKSSVGRLTKPIISKQELFQAHEQCFKNASPACLGLLRRMFDLSASPENDFSLIHLQALVLNFFNKINVDMPEDVKIFINKNVWFIARKYLDSLAAGECLICNKTKDSGLMITLACGHSFCQNCLFKWFLQSLEAEDPKPSRSCPLCRQEMHKAIQDAFKRHPTYLKVIKKQEDERASVLRRIGEIFNRITEVHGQAANSVLRLNEQIVLLFNEIE